MSATYKIDSKYQQVIPIAFAIFVFIIISLAYSVWIKSLNLLPGDKIQLGLNPADILVGLTIYLKTSVDFALVIGILMKNYPGLKNRLAIETGTAVGNALGTFIILGIWYFFKEIQWLLATMILIASLVLLKLAEGSLEHGSESHNEIDRPKWLINSTEYLKGFLSPLNHFFSPLISKLVPEMSFKAESKLSFFGLALASFSVPFILGLDDFAGYVPLFNVVQVFGFGIGVFLGHCILNIFLFLNPKKTIEIVKNPIIGVIGSVVFIGLAGWGFYESIKIIVETYFHS